MLSHSCSDVHDGGLIYTKKSLSRFVSIKESSFGGLNVAFLKVDFRLFPGAARNVGIIFSESSYIAFLDVNTLPGDNWLSTFLGPLSDCSTHSPLLGATVYDSDTYSKKIIIAATYGFLPITTLPGTILHRSQLWSVGLMNTQWRAGEDIDFMVRLNSLFPNCLHSSHPIHYDLKSGNPAYYFLKWIRNYSDSAPYSALVNQSHALIVLVLLFIFAIVFRWNASFAGWDENSIFYLRNVTKPLALHLLVFYCLLRGLYIPSRKGAFAEGSCGIADVLPILLVSFILDFAKIIALMLMPYSLFKRSCRLIYHRRLSSK